ncbi:MAG: PIN domain-containing protein [Actinobacteria bacterium]|nr:PIN domain-containing protein [Actinomycetota bacterium]
MNAEPGAVYLDSSALVKLVIDEAESEQLRDHLAARPVRVACALVRVEVPRAVAGQGRRARDRARRLLGGLHVIALDDPLLDQAATLGPGALRSLDAIHIAAALELGDQLESLVTYDSRMIDSALRLGVSVASPGALS